MRLKLFFFPISIVVTLAAFIWFLKPAWGENKEARKELNDEKKTLQSLVEKSASLERSLAHYQALSGEVELLNNAMPEDETSDKLVAELNDRARETGIFINKIEIKKSKVKVSSPEPEQIKAMKEGDGDEEKGSSSSKNQASLVESNLTKLEMSLEIAGDYIKARNFISSLGQTNRFIKVVATDFSRSATDKEGGVPGMVSGNVSCEAFYKTEKEAVEISKLVFANDETMKRLLTGKVGEDIIKEFQSQRTSQAYKLIMGTGQAGKENIFIGNTAQ